MGYTHFHTKKEIAHPQDKWDAFLVDAKKVASNFDLCIPQSIDFIKDGEGLCGNPKSTIKIGDGMGEGNPPDFSGEGICFNEVGDDSHETLAIDRDSSENLEYSNYLKEEWENNGRLFSFTKTARKPYDLLVTATLVLYKHHFGDKVDVSGDGGPQGFEEGLELVNTILLKDIKMKDIFPEEED